MKKILIVLVAVLTILGVEAQPSGPRKKFDMSNLYKEKYRSQYHFSPKMGRVGDPSGCLYYQGKYHMFWWGKVESSDLVHYTEIGTEREIMKNGPRKMGYFTGSVAVDRNNTSGWGENTVVAAYTSYDHETKKQSQSVSFSHDGGRSFYYYDNNPVIDLWSTEFRDPTVFWHAESGQWVMVVAKALEKKVKFYTSPNLKDWTWASDFGPSGDSQRSWECPDMFTITMPDGSTKWVLLVSINWDQEQYFFGDFDGKTFTLLDGHPTTALLVDHGIDYYASRTFRDYDGALGGKVLTIGWVASWEYETVKPKINGERPLGFWSVPREYKVKAVDGFYRLTQTPIDALTTLRDQSLTFSKRLKPGKVEIPKIPTLANTYDMEVSFAVTGDDVLGLNLCVGEGRKVALTYDTQSQNFFVDRTNSSDVKIAGFDRTSFARVPLVDGKLTLRVFVDKTSVEVFAQDGEKVFTMLTFASETQTGAEVFSLNGNTTATIKAWRMKSIWNE